jgi:large subunit ribosomal protein L3
MKKFLTQGMKMSKKLIGKKIGMTQIFDSEGKLVPCTVIQVNPNIVTAIKTEERDGYCAVQVGVPHRKKKNLQKPQRTALEKKELPACSILSEFRVANPQEYQSGAKLGVEVFSENKFIDVIGTSKGKGYQGVMKKYGFAGGPAAHGSGFHRHAGSTGMRSTPGRCFPGGKRASQMGGERVTVQTIKVIYVDKDKNLILVSGSIPGSNGSVVFVREPVKVA